MKAETARNFALLSAAVLALFSLPVLLPALLTLRMPGVLTCLVPVFPAAALVLAVLFSAQLAALFFLRRNGETPSPAVWKLRMAAAFSLAVMLGGSAGVLFFPGWTAFAGSWAVYGFLFFEVFLGILLWLRPPAPPRRLGIVCCVCAGCFALYIVSAWGARMLLDRRAMADDEAARALGAAQSWQELAERYCHGEKPDPDFDRLIADHARMPEAERRALWDALLAKPGPLKSTRSYDGRSLLAGSGPEQTLHNRMFLLERDEVFPDLLRQKQTAAALSRWERLGDWLDTTVADSQGDELLPRALWLDIAQLMIRSGACTAEQKRELTRRLARAEKVHRGAFLRFCYPELFLTAARAESCLRTGGDTPRAFQRKKPLLGGFAAFPAYAAVMLQRSRAMRALITAIREPEKPPCGPEYVQYHHSWKLIQNRFQNQGGTR